MENPFKRIDFSDTEYTVKQSLIRNKYRIFNGDGELILKAKQKMFRMKEEFPFTDSEGDVIFRIKAARRLDIAGDYGIIDEKTGEKVGILSKKFTLFKHVWHVKDPEGKKLASIESQSSFLEFLRSISDIFSLVPHKYTIQTHGGDELGRIRGKFSLKDTYRVTLEKEDFPGKELVIAAAITLDALEGN